MISLFLATCAVSFSLAADRVIKAGSSADKKSAWIASFKQDPATAQGEQDAVVFAMGTSLPGGASAPPFMFVGYARGNVTTKNVENVGDLIGAKSIVRNKAGLLYVHYALGEYCDVDGDGKYTGAWPPRSNDMTLAELKALGVTKLQNDTFIQGGLWSSTTFSEISTSAMPVTGSLSSANGVYTLKCRTTNKDEMTMGLALGPYRVKCDVIIRPGTFWIDNKFDGLAEIAASALGCGKANRKIAMLAFVAGNAVGNVEAGAATKWQQLKASAASFEWVEDFTVQDSETPGAGDLSGKISSQIFDPKDIFPPAAKLSSFASVAKAALFTFNLGRDQITGSKLIYWDPTVGYGADPATLDTGVAVVDAAPTATSNAESTMTKTVKAASATTSMLSLAAVVVAMLFVVAF